MTRQTQLEDYHMNGKNNLGFAASLGTALKTMSGVSVLCFAFVSPALAQDSCRLETFRGDYGLTATGFLLPPITTGEFGFGGGEGAVPIQGVQLITSDGNGNLKAKESLNLGGQPLVSKAGDVFSKYDGTYEISSDCTGAAFLTDTKFICPNNPSNCPTASFVKWAFIIEPAGRKIRMVAVPPYDTGGIERVISSIGEKLVAE